MPEWTETQAEAFWTVRRYLSVHSQPLLTERLQNMRTMTESRRERWARERQLFVRERDWRETGAAFVPANITTAQKLTFWLKFCSWSFCSLCGSVSPLPLFPQFAKNTSITNSKDCGCQKDRYCYPLYDLVPEELKGLQPSDIIILRPFDIHCGQYVVKQHGYRQKTSLFQIKPSRTSVEDKIAALPEGERKRVCRRAFCYLMECEHSSYNLFKQIRDDIMCGQAPQLNTYDMDKTKHIECALWPNLYPFKSWCDSGMEGHESRLSCKRSFWIKLCSEIIDFSTDFELLQYQYDRWLFKTVSGAISTARVMHCSAAKALEAKPFSATYWQWQHRYLMDAVRQYGPPSIFVTISPYEWSFPFPFFINAARQISGRGIQRLAVLETCAIAHALEQIVRGYLCGSNTAKWANNVFSYNNLKTTRNVQTYFYRFEFQGRGTVHMHMLVWLKDLSKIQLPRVRADIPAENEEMAFRVYKCQKSDKPSHCLQVQENATFCTDTEGNKTLHLRHPADAFAVNLRAYIDTLVPSLKCSMDVQTSDGHGMLLKYVASYVAKWQDSLPVDSLYCFDLSGRQAAFRYLTCHNPCEPEMALTISPIKVAWTNSNTKQYTVPRPTTIEWDKLVQLYWRRPASLNDMSLLQWLREHTIQGQNVKPYKHVNTLVGVKYLSYFNELYYFQYSVMHKPHRSVDDLYVVGNRVLPSPLIHYGNACFFFPDLWENIENIRQMLINEGHAEHYIRTVIAFIASMRDSILYVRRHILASSSFEAQSDTANQAQQLSVQQQQIVEDIVSACEQRGATYQRSVELDDEHDMSLNVEEHDCTNENVGNNVPWASPILLTGKPGTGKTHVILESVRRITEREGQVLITCPTGFLSSVLRVKTREEVRCDTVHSAFLYPVEKEQYPRVNYDLAMYDIIVIDEISMISEAIFKHILKTLNCLPLRPVLLLSGDNAQMQPFDTTNARCRNILSDNHFLSSCTKYNLKEQFRIVDKAYQDVLNIMRYFTPSQTQLESLCEGRVLLPTVEPTEQDICTILQTHADFHILTYTRKAACTINRHVINWYTRQTPPIGRLQMDWDDGLCNVFAGMVVVLTQNRNKDRGFVNGQKAIIRQIHNSTVLVEYEGGIQPVYPVTQKAQEGQGYIVRYPFMPAYALTIAKAQGQTISKLILWLDIDNVAPGAAYVALSRVRRLEDLKFLCPVNTTQFKPVR